MQTRCCTAPCAIAARASLSRPGLSSALALNALRGSGEESFAKPLPLGRFLRRGFSGNGFHPPQVDAGFARARSVDGGSSRSGPPSKKYIPRYNFVSQDVDDASESWKGLPVMSSDGGSQEEFERYWDANEHPRHIGGGFVERCSHPQINAEKYWYNDRTGELTWIRPENCSPDESVASSSCSRGDMVGHGPVWEWDVPSLKMSLANADGHEIGRYRDLARRAVHEYETFQPRVLSWHDFQNLTFWFFGGLKKTARKTAIGSRGYFDGKGNEMFAESAFFEESAKVIESRLDLMHPICLTYFIWTFTRAGVILPDLMKAVGDHLVKGRIQMMDRCSLGTMVWNFGKQKVRHDVFFEAAAQELSRANRVRSFAPRNYQNTILAYGWQRHLNKKMFREILRGMPRLLGPHDPPTAKLKRSLCFAYTCKDGSEVLADSFRITGLTVILKSLHLMKIEGPEMDKCVLSMLDYVQRSVDHSPSMMREPGDACRFLIEMAKTIHDIPSLKVAEALSSDRIPSLQVWVQNAPQAQIDELRREFRRAKINNGTKMF